MQSPSAAWLVASGQAQIQQGLTVECAPILLAELLGVNRLYATRIVHFGGPRLLGDGLILGSGVLLGAQLPEYALDLAAGGIGEVGMSLNDSAQAVQMSSAGISLLNQVRLVEDLAGVVLDNTLVRVRLGFAGLGHSDYLPLWSGVIDRYDWDQAALRLDCLDGSFQRHRNLSVAIGGQYFPGTPFANRNKHIPILLGALIDLEPIQVTGFANGTLGFAMTISSPAIDIKEFGAPFPPTGTVQIHTAPPELGVTYTRRRLINVVGRTYLRLEGLTRGSPAAHTINESVTLTNLVYTYLVGYAVASVDEVRSEGIVLTPGVDYQVLQFATGADRAVTLITFAVDLPGITVDVNAINIATTALLTNGGFESGDTSGWTLEAGGTAVVGTSLPDPQEGDYRLALTGGLGTFRGLSQEVATIPGQMYQLMFEYQNAEVNSLVTNGGFEAGTLTGWTIREQTNCAATVQTPGLGDGAYSLLISGVLGSSTYRFEMYQDVGATIGQNYWFNFINESLFSFFSQFFGGGNSPAVSVRRSLSSIVSYKIGSTTNDTKYAPETRVNFTSIILTRGFTSQAAFNNNFNGFGLLAADTTIRLSLIVQGVAISDDFLYFLDVTPPPARLDTINFQLSSVQDTSTAGLRIGTPAAPATYVDTAYDARQAWTGATATFTALTALTRIELRSKYALTSKATYFDAVVFEPILEAGSRTGGENPVAAIRYILQTFLPHLRPNDTSFLAAYQQRLAWRFRAILTDPGDSKALLERMAYQAGLLYREDADGQVSLVPLDSSRATVYGFVSSNIVEDTFKADMESLDNIYTSIYVWFGAKAGGTTNPTDFAGVAYATPEETTDPLGAGLMSQCRNTLQFFGREHRLDVYADFIADVETATLFLRYLVERHCLRHTLYTFETWMDAARLQVGDVVEIVDPLATDPLPIRAEVTAQPTIYDQASVRITARGFEQSLWEANFEYDPILLEDTVWEANFDYTDTTADTELWEADFETDDALFARARRVARHTLPGEDEDD